MIQKTRITVASAYEALNQYLNQFRWSPLNANELKIFYDIKNRLATLLKQTHWQKADSYFFSKKKASQQICEKTNKSYNSRHIHEATHTKLNSNQILKSTDAKPYSNLINPALFKSVDDYKSQNSHAITQADINLLAKTTYRSTLNFTYRILIKFLYDYSYFANADQRTLMQVYFCSKHKKIIDLIYQCIAITLTCLTEGRPIKNKDNETILELTPLEEVTYSGKSSLYQLASSLGAPYLPSTQLFDTLRGKEIVNNVIKKQGGLCVGHVLSWSNEIKKSGYSLLLFRSDTFTLENQNKKFAPSLFRSISIYNRTSIPSSINTLLNKIDCLATYKINVYSHNGMTKHAMGLRMIPKTKQIEFVDPNFVNPIIFDNINDFKVWFSYLLQQEYFKNGGIQIKLSMLDSQPINAKTSIPPIN